MSGHPATLAHLEQVNAYYKDPAQAPHRSPPQPPTPEIAAEIAATAAQLTAHLLEYYRTGASPDQEPSMQTRLEVAEMFDRYTEARNGDKEAQAWVRQKIQQFEEESRAQGCPQPGGGGGQHWAQEIWGEEDVQDVGDRPSTGGQEEK